MTTGFQEKLARRQSRQPRRRGRPELKDYFTSRSACMGQVPGGVSPPRSAASTRKWSSCWIGSLGQTRRSRSVPICSCRAAVAPWAG